MDEKKLISRLTDDLNIISLLDNEPNDVGGLSAEELKAEFDEAGLIIQNYINNILLPELAGENGAGNIGITTVPGLTGAQDAQRAIERIVEMMQEMTQGAVADGSITAAKLAPKSVTKEKIASGAVGTTHIADKSVTTEKLADKAITAALLADKIITALQIANKAVGTEQLADAAVTNAKLGEKCVGSANIDDLSVPARALQAGAVETVKIKDETITAAKIAPAARTQRWTLTVTTSWAGEEPPFTQEIAADGMEENDIPKVDRKAPAFEALEAYEEEYTKIYDVYSAENKITLYAKEKTNNPINVFVEVSRI